MLDGPHPLCPVISFVITMLAGPVDVVLCFSTLIRTLPLSSTILLVNSSIVMFSTTPGLCTVGYMMFAAKNDKTISVIIYFQYFGVLHNSCNLASDFWILPKLQWILNTHYLLLTCSIFCFLISIVIRN